MFRNNSLAEMVGKASSVKVLMTVVRRHTSMTSFAACIIFILPSSCRN